jgi:hypothetical protein
MHSEVNSVAEGPLGNFTVCLETPCVPGELEQWAVAVRDAAQAAGEFLAGHVRQNHQEHYARIVAADTEMFRKVEQLKQEDQNLLQCFERLTARIKRIAEQAPRVEPDEARLRGHVDVLIHDGLEFVVRWEQQEIAIRNWLQEAFVRECGVGD